MSKILRAAALVVGAVAVVVATGGAAAIGVGNAAAAATATTAATAATIGGISASTLGLVASGLSLAAGLTAKKPSGPGGGSQTSWRPEESRVGKEWVRTCRSRWAADTKK